MIKISKKASVIVILAIMAVIIFGFGGIIKYEDNSSAKNRNNYYDDNIKFQKDEVNRQLEAAKAQLAEIQKKKSSADELELQNLESEEISLQNQVDMFQFAINKEIDLSSNSFRTQATQRLFNYKLTESRLNSIPAAELFEEQKKQLLDAQSNISILQSVIENKDFKQYISFLNSEINSDTSKSDEEKKIYLESNELRIKYNLSGEVDGKANDGDANNNIYQIENGKLSLLNDFDQTGGSQNQKSLTPELRQNIKNQIAVAEYKLENSTVNNTTTNNIGMNINSIAMPGMLGIGTFITVILVMILAGGSVSSELSTGSIKSLIISPTKRWKIFIAKFLSLLTIGVIATLFAYIFAVIANGIFFGFDSGSPYIYASNGVAHELNFYIYRFATLFTDFIGVIVFMTFALMLSIITRNTAASVAISIAVFFVGSNANMILMQYLKGDWRKFIPFNNLTFTSKIFPNDGISQVTNGMTGVVNNSLTFSLIYVAILLVCMGYTGLDSFNRRDIK